MSDYDELAVSLQVLATPGMPTSQGDRVAVVTDSGGEAGLAADLIHRYDLRLPEFSVPTLERLADVLPGAGIGNPLDAGASPGASDDVYLPTYAAVLADENVDALMVIVEGHQSITHGELHYSTELASALRERYRAPAGQASDCRLQFLDRHQRGASKLGMPRCRWFAGSATPSPHYRLSPATSSRCRTALSGPRAFLTAEAGAGPTRAHS